MWKTRENPESDSANEVHKRRWNGFTVAASPWLLAIWSYIWPLVRWYDRCFLNLLLWDISLARGITVFRVYSRDKRGYFQMFAILRFHGQSWTWKPLEFRTRSSKNKKNRRSLDKSWFKGSTWGCRIDRRETRGTITQSRSSWLASIDA